MTDITPPKIEFPCRYPVKIVGTNSIDFVARVTLIVREHAPELAEGDVSVKLSRGGKFCSTTCVIVATGEAQLRALHDELRGFDAVSMVL